MLLRDKMANSLQHTRHLRTPQGERPTLTYPNVDKYLDWVMNNQNILSGQEVENHLRAAELVVRTGANEAQAKATQHTLVEDGTIDPPPAAS